MENGSWAPQAAKVMKSMLEGCKDLSFTKNPVHILSALSDESRQQIEDLSDELSKDYLAQREETANKNDMTALFKIGYGLYAVTSNDGSRDNGLIVNTVTQLTDNPFRVAVNINKTNYSHHIIKQTGVMNVNCLSVEAPFKVFRTFGFQSGRTVDKFAGCEPLRSDNGLIFLPWYINAFFSLKVEQYADLGTHGMFICSVTEARVISDVETMTYTYYQKNVKPRPETEGKKGFVCKVCGYVYEGDELPDDIVCPLCKHGAARIYLCYIRTSKLYTEYLNVNLLGYPFGIRPLALIWLPVFTVVFFSWAMLIQHRRRPGAAFRHRPGGGSGGGAADTGGAGGYQPWIVESRPYESVYGDASQDLQRVNAAAAMMFLIVCCAASGAFERQSGVVYMLRSLKRGRRGIFARKLLTAAVMTALVCVMVYFREFDQFVTYWKPASLAAPVGNFDILARFPINMTMGQYITLVYALRFLMLYLLALAVMFVSSLTPTVELAYIVNITALGLPAVLFALGIDLLGYVSPIQAVSAAEGLWALGTTGDWSGLVPFAVWLIAGGAALALNCRRWTGARRVSELRGPAGA